MKNYKIKTNFVNPEGTKDKGKLWGWISYLVYDQVVHEISIPRFNNALSNLYGK